MTLTIVPPPVDPMADPDVMVGDWHVHEAVFMCGPRRGGLVPPDECDCGCVAHWDRRMTYRWHETPGRRRQDASIRRDIARGWPARSRDEGYWVMDGHDARCPGCGDIERLDADCNVIATYVNESGHRDQLVLREYVERV